MKFPFFKAILAASAIFTLVGCGEDSPSKSSDENQPSQAIVVEQPSWIFTQKGLQYAIGVDNSVTDTNGAPVGTFDPATGNIVAADMSVIASGIDLNTLTVVLPPVINSTAWILSADQLYIIYPAVSGAVDAAGNSVGTVTDAEGNQIGTFVYDATLTGSIIGMDGVTPIIGGVNAAELKVHESNVIVETPVLSSSSVSQPVSSANVPKSSSSVVASSSSVVQSSSSQASGFTIKYVSGGKSGSGWATRYWDCCKPHCAWPDKGGLKAHACDAQGNKINDDGASSMCDGGNAGTCVSQIPQVYNDTIAFAFAAVPGSAGGKCGKCFDLAFTGKGKYASDNNLAKLKGKHLIVIASNIGYDVSEGQFDVMIPGGGTGIFNGCASKMGWGSQGEQYGGLLSECEKESNYTASKYKSCLTSKCEKSFANDPKAKEGCLFLANWMNAAGNPLHNYKEVECPKELLDKF